jgi:osomolarity two-component system response regulator SKN7
MNDVLPKPFTKEGMLRTLEKHLGHLKRNPIPFQNPSGFSTPGVAPNQPMGLNMSHMSAAHSVKDDPSPGKSPASSWHSPGQLGTSPSTNQEGYLNANMGAMRGNPQYTMAPGNAMPGFQTPPHAPRNQTHRRVMSEMSGGPDQDEHNKRQRMYQAQQGGFAQ